MDQLKVKKALILSRTAHKDQMYGNEPYFNGHILKVYNKVDYFTKGDVNPVCAAILHDVVEDTPVTLEDIREQFGNEIMELVDALTRREAEGEPKEEYLQRIISSNAIIVKLGDTITNLMKNIQENNPQRALKYVQSLTTLLEGWVSK